MTDPEPRWTSRRVDQSRLRRPARAARATLSTGRRRDDRATPGPGLYDMTPDAHPIVGRVADGVYAACGFSGARLHAVARGRPRRRRARARGRVVNRPEPVRAGALRRGRGVAQRARALAAAAEHDRERDHGGRRKKLGRLSRARRTWRVASTGSGTRVGSARGRRRRAASPDAAQPRTSGTSGTSQIGNWGENTFPNASVTAVAAAA